jgi:uncharacterized alpha-E superfamily protein
MLARTADHLYWLARYMERADFVARIVDAAMRLSTLPKAYGGASGEWESALSSAGALERYRDIHAEVSAGRAIDFLVFDERNPSSLVNCMANGRTNARAVRTALTMEMWQSVNDGWLDMRHYQNQRYETIDYDRERLAQLIELVKKTSLDFDGAAYRTMLRNDAYFFQRLGLYVERADNTARLLDVKYNILLPDTEVVGGSLDYFQWTALLRAVSAHTAYYWVYRDGVKPWLIADLMILRDEMPRSLIACYENIVRFLDAIARAYGRQGAAQRHARNVYSRLSNANMKDIFHLGLHEFITGFVDDNNAVGAEITTQYLSY